MQRSKDLQDLKELVFILNRYKVRQIEVITNAPGTGSKSSRYRKFYEALLTEQWQSEEDAAAWLGYCASDKQYKRFRNEFKKRLYNTTLFIDTNQPEFSDPQRAYYRSWQEVAVLKTLVGRGTTINATAMARQLLEVAQKYEITEIALECARHLRQYYAVKDGTEVMFQHYSDLVRNYMEIYQAELMAGDYYEQIIISYTRSKAGRRENGLLANKYLAQLTPYLARYESHNLVVYSSMIAIFERMCVFDWAGTIELCQSALDKLNNRPSVSPNVISSFLHQITVCHTMLGQYRQAHERAVESLGKATEGSHNWFKSLEVLLANAMHAGDYALAWQTYRTATGHVQFQRLSDPVREPWNLYRAYLGLAIKLRLLDVSPREKGDLARFRLARFLNEVPIFSRDKRGMNIPVLIAQVLFLLIEKRFDEVEERLEGLRKYKSRHFSEDGDHFRTDCFFRLLYLLLKCDFQPVKMEAKAAPLLTQMTKVGINLADQTHELEIIPYEKQWEWVLLALQPQKTIAPSSPVSLAVPSRNQ